jgi:hypothetical protein
MLQLVARIGWVGLAVLALGLFIAGVPDRLDELRGQYQRHLGFSVFQVANGEVMVSPWSGGVASQAGVLERDILVDSDGVPLRGASGFEVAESMATGPVGAPVTVHVRTGARPMRTYTVILGGEAARALEPLGLSYAAVAAYVALVDSIAVLILTAVTAVIFWRKPRGRLPMLVSVTMLAFIAGSAPVIALYRSRPAWQPPIDFLFSVALGCVLVFFFLFPDGRFVPRWTRTASGVAGAWCLVAPLAPELYPWRLSSWPGLLAILACLSIGAFAQAFRYVRASTALQRQQTKWVVCGAVLAAIGLAAQLAIEVVGDRESSLAVLRDELVVRPLSQALIGLLPLTIGIALLRYRLWDVDPIINRALVYGLLTAGLGLAYWGGMVLFQQLLRPLTQGSEVSVIGSTLLVAALFQPARGAIQRWVDRRFYRHKYDAQRTLAKFGATVRNDVELDTLVMRLVDVARDTVQPSHAFVWLRPTTPQLPERLSHQAPRNDPGTAEW